MRSKKRFIPIRVPQKALYMGVKLTLCLDTTCRAPCGPNPAQVTGLQQEGWWVCWWDQQQWGCMGPSSCRVDGVMLGQPLLAFLLPMAMSTGDPELGGRLPP